MAQKYYATEKPHVQDWLIWMTLLRIIPNMVTIMGGLIIFKRNLPNRAQDGCDV